MFVPLAVAVVSVLPAPERPGEPLPPHVTARYGSLHYRVPGPVYASALSPDGKLLAVAAPGGVRLYEVPAWRLARELPAVTGPTGPVSYWPPVAARPLAFSPDGKHLAYRRTMDAVSVWDLTADRPARGLRAPARDRWVPLLAFVPDGLALADPDAVTVYDPATGAEVRSVPVGNVQAVSPDGRVFVRADRPKGVLPGYNPGEAVIGDARTGKDLRRLGRTPPQHDHCRDGLAFAPGGKTFAFLGRHGRSVEVRDVATGAVVAARDLPEEAYEPGLAGFEHCGPGVGFTPDGAVFVVLPSGVWRWDPVSGKELPRLAAAGGSPPGGGLHALPDGTLLAPTAEGWVRAWSADGTEWPIPGRYRGTVSVALSPDGTLAAVADDAGRIDLRDTATGTFVRTVRTAGRWGRGMAFSPDGRLLAAGWYEYELGTTREAWSGGPTARPRCGSTGWPTGRRSGRSAGG
ncbi:MAG: WD40 repeat domain-containing protein [Gemmataceae bacterium]|nr:WD40 repeat domain-containing protein [Gemmataceae bacterium]